MNTTHKVSIGGMAFVVEESAYKELKLYIDKLENQFRHRADGSEIIADIESRIAELINGKLLNPDQLVTLADVKDVIFRLGDPSEMDEGAEKSVDDTTYSTASASSRRLYRSAESKVIAGVCGGLGAYFNIDPVWLRIAFVALTIIGSPIAVGWVFLLTYIILWISTPYAISVSQKLEMEGKKVTVSTIEQRIRDEANAYAPHVRSAGDRLFSVFIAVLKIFVVFFISIFVIVGLALSAALLALLVGFEPSFLFNFGDYHDGSLAALFNVMYSFFPNVLWFNISLLALVFIPTILLIVLAIKLMFRSHFRTRFVAIPLVAVWLVALFATFITGVSTLKNSFGSSRTVAETVVAPAAIDTLKIGYSSSIQLKANDVSLVLHNECDDEEWSHDGFCDNRDWIHHDGFSITSADSNPADVKLTANSTVYVRPLVEVKYDENIEKPQVVVKKWATGRNYTVAGSTAESINFKAEFKGDSLLISPAVPLLVKDRILKGVKLTVRIPKNKFYRIGDEMKGALIKTRCSQENGVYRYDANNYTDNEWDNVESVDTVMVR